MYVQYEVSLAALPPGTRLIIQCSCFGLTYNIIISCSSGHQCEKLVSPTNGKMQCTGNTTDHSCSFTCNPGYDLRGSSNRSCNASGKWTGDETMCESKYYKIVQTVNVAQIHQQFFFVVVIHCQKPLAPRHGFVYTPCDTPFGSECIVGCMRGYFMKEKGKITCNATGVWYPDNLSCTSKFRFQIPFQYFSTREVVQIYESRIIKYITSRAQNILYYEP